MASSRVVTGLGELDDTACCGAVANLPDASPYGLKLAKGRSPLRLSSRGLYATSHVSTSMEPTN